VTLGTRISRYAIAPPIGAMRYKHGTNVRTGRGIWAGARGPGSGDYHRCDKSLSE